MVKQKKVLLVIDANSVIHRAFHALPPLKLKTGQIVNAVYGFCLIFLRALKELEPDYIVAAFDSEGPTFRHKKYEEYKAQRPKQAQELYDQFGLVKQVLEVFGVPFYEKKGFEADDIIATIVKRAEKHRNLETIILSGDLDSLQLVSDKTKVYAMKKGIKETILYNREKVGERYNGLKPEQLKDYRALRGDASDNIPGVKGIGEKTAINLLKKFGSLENIYNALKKGEGDISLKWQKILRNYKREAFLSRELAEMKTNVPVNFSLEKAKIKGVDLQRIKSLFERLEFKSLVKRIFDVYLKDKELRRGRQLGHLEDKEFGHNFEQTMSHIKKLKQEGILSDKVADIEVRLIPVVEEMEKRGIMVDQEKLKSLSDFLNREINNLGQQIFQMAGAEFNLNSPQQLGQVLFKKMSLSTDGLKKTPGGAISTSESELLKIQREHPIIPLILNYRRLFKLKTGFCDALPKMVADDGRIHPCFHQLGTETGRMSCSNPNLQNIPQKTKEGRKIRECFVPTPGYLFLSADYSQVEMRIAASIANDKKMLDLFKQGKDIHTITASQILEIPEKEVERDQRNLAKTLNFGILYGMGPHGLSERTRLSFAEAQSFINQYFQKFQGIAQYVEGAIETAKQKGFAETILGRKRFLPEINSRNTRIRRQAERMAINHPIQGSCADIIKMAMVKLAEQRILDDDCWLLLQIHDELLFEVKKGKIKEKAKEIKEIMENVVRLKIPLKTEIKVGDNWGSLYEI